MSNLIGLTFEIDGKRATVTSRWGQGKNSVFALSDGRTVLDLDKRVESGEISPLPSRGLPVDPEPGPDLDDDEEEAFERLPYEEEDYEE